MRTVLLTVAALIVFASTTHSQSKIGGNTSVKDSTALLELESTNRGVLLPRLTAAQRDAINSPANGLVVFNTTENCLNIYNVSVGEWQSLCRDVTSGTAQYTVDCSSLLVSGSFTTGEELDPAANTMTVSVTVSEPGTYTMVADGGGMFFVATGEFLVEGTQDVTLSGRGVPLSAGAIFVLFRFGKTLCSTVITVTNGIAVVTACGTAGTLTGNIYANETISDGEVFMTYSPGPTYAGGDVFGLTSSISNGIRISSPVNGRLNGTGSPIDFVISGKPTMPGMTPLSFSINGQNCSFNVPVQSGMGRASAVGCGGALSGTYQVDRLCDASNTKVITLTVTTAGTFYVRTNTANGIYFAGSATLAVGAQNMLLTAVGTPQQAVPTTYTVTVSQSATLFTSCTFSVTPTLPSVVPDFSTLTCSPLGVQATGVVNYIKAPNSGSGDYFGSYIGFTQTNYAGKAISISNNGLWLAVGAPFEDGSLAGGAINSTNNDAMLNSGAVYIYQRNSTANNWTFHTKIKPTQLDAQDAFGHALDINDDGTTLVVGSYLEDGSGTGVDPAHNNGVSGAGAAYVFVRNANVWTQQAYLKPRNTASQAESFGASVAISGDGNTIAVGAYNEDGSIGGIDPVHNNNMSNSGAVHLYTRQAGVWVLDVVLKAAVPTENDHFGKSVALDYSGTTLAVGSDCEDGLGRGINPTKNNLAPRSGAAFIFAKAAQWTQQAYIKNINMPMPDDRFGVSVDLSSNGNVLVVGAVFEDGTGRGVNPPFVLTPSGGSGAAYTYSRSGTVWSTGAYLKPLNNSNLDYFGSAVAISGDGNVILVGATQDDANTTCVNGADNSLMENAGCVYSFHNVSGTWTSTFIFRRLTDMTSPLRLQFGSSVALDNNGRTVVVGTGEEDGAATTINGPLTGLKLESGCVVTWTRN